MATRNLRRAARKAKAVLRDMERDERPPELGILIAGAIGSYLTFWTLGQFVDRRWHYASILPTAMLAFELFRLYKIEIPEEWMKRVREHPTTRRAMRAARRITQAVTNATERAAAAGATRS
jgi:hypothetical protein